MRGNRELRLLAFTLTSILAVMLGCDTSSNVEPIYQNYFIKTFGGDGDQEGVDIIVNSDETLTMLGNSIKPTGARKILFLKTDFKGKILFEKELGDSLEMAVDIEPLVDGYIILSNVFVDESRYDIKLIQTNLEGDSIGGVVISGLSDQFAKSVTPVSDGRYFVTGKTRDTDIDANAELDIPDQEDLLIIELSNTFTVLNTFRIGRSSTGLGVKVYENGSSFTYAGYSDEIRLGDNYNTNFIFRTFINDPRAVPTLYVGDNVAQEEMSSFVRMPNGSFYGIGTETSGTGLREVFVTSVVNSQGVPQKVYSGNVGSGTLEGISGYPSQNGSSIFVLANEFSSTGETSNIRLIKVNAFLGDEKWSQQYGSGGYDEKGNALAELPNGDIVIVGTVNLINQLKLTLIKVNSNGKFN